jgi:hypothetical protein
MFSEKLKAERQAQMEDDSISKSFSKSIDESPAIFDAEVISESHSPEQQDLFIPVEN